MPGAGAAPASHRSSRRPAGRARWARRTRGTASWARLFLLGGESFLLVGRRVLLDRAPAQGVAERFRLALGRWTLLRLAGQLGLEGPHLPVDHAQRGGLLLKQLGGAL